MGRGGAWSAAGPAFAAAGPAFEAMMKGWTGTGEGGLGWAGQTGYWVVLVSDGLIMTSSGPILGNFFHRFSPKYL